MSMPNPDRGLYSISVAAELTGVGPQTLRLYEMKGLLVPARTDGGTRRYSDHDIQRIQRIAELTATGLNLAGVSLVLELEAENDVLREQLTRARRQTDPYES
ncbi:MAG TPA: MerR family transcriptional regulator [Jiangellaceae bacterium]